MPMLFHVVEAWVGLLIWARVPNIIWYLGHTRQYYSTLQVKTEVKKY